MMPAGVVGRPATMALNPRSTGLSDFGTVPGKNAEDRSSHPTTLSQGFGSGSKAWNQGNIWATSSLGTGFGSSVRDVSRSRENSSYLGPGNDSLEGKTGSGSLVASSESDSWSRNRSHWGTGDASHSNIEQRRSSGVSPARQRGGNASQAQQPYVENAQSISSYFSLSRTAPVNSSVTPKPVSKPANKALIDTNPTAFALSRQFEPPANGFGTFNRFPEMDGQAQRSSDPLGGSWGEGDSIHSPADDRGSIANSEYFGTPSAAQSRSGSLPPSRHGEPTNQLPQPSDTFPRFAPGPSRGHTSSFSSQTNGRAHQERSGSIQSDSVAMFGRLSIDGNAEQTIALHKPSVSVNGVHTPFTQGSQEATFPRTSLSDYPQNYIRSDDQQVGANGNAFAPDGFPISQYGDQVAQLRAFHLSNRGAMTPNGSDFRQSPFYSAGGTPPVYDHLYPSRNDHAARAMSNAPPALLERKLRGLQQEQQGYLHSQYQQMLAAAHFRGPFNPYPYTLPNGLTVNGLTPVLPAVHTVMQVVEPPKGPRELEPGQAIRSALLEEFKANSKTNKRYELKDIYDHIVEFSGDQHGSRFIQQKLETANSDEKDRVFKELQIESLQLMQDVFGNYVIQKFFEHGDQNQKKVLANKMKGQVLSLSLQMYGCRVVQKALEHILTDQQASLIRELENHVLKCVKDQNGNHVIQKAIERVPAEHIQFIINAFTGQVGQLATHPYGCRVIQRMLEYCEEPARRSILQELHACGPTLISDQYGNYVTQHVIEHGSPDDRAKIIDLVKAQLLPFSKHKFASNVVEKCLVFSNDQQRREIMQKVIEKTDRGESGLAVLIRDGYGNYVIQKLLDTLNAEDYALFAEHLQPEVAKAKRTISGKQIQSVEKKMHRFDRNTRNSISSNAATSDQSRVPSPPPQRADVHTPANISSMVPDASTIDEAVKNANSTDRSTDQEADATVDL